MNKINKTNLTDQTKIRLNKITEIEDYFHREINQRKSCSKKLSKYVTAFDYIDKILIVLSATSSGVCIISSASVVGAPVEIACASFTLTFFLTKEIIKKLLSITRSKKKRNAVPLKIPGHFKWPPEIMTVPLKCMAPSDPLNNNTH